MSWKLRAVLTALAHGYNRDYRFNPVERKGINWLADDLLPLELIDEDGMGFHPEAVRRAINGQKDSEGIRKFAVPRDELLSQIIRFVTENELISNIALHEPVLEVPKERPAGLDGQNLDLIDPAIASGIWGDFLGVRQNEKGLEYVLHTWCYDPDKALCSVRRISMAFWREDDELFCDFARRVRELQFDHYAISDYWGVIGTFAGLLFDSDVGARRLPIGGASFSKKGRALSYSESFDNPAHDTRMRLVELPEDIELVLAIRRQIDAIEGLPVAA